MPNMTLPEALALALRHHEAGELEPAESIYRQLLAIHPSYAQAMHLLGVLVGDRGNLDEGIALIRQSIALEPTAQYWANLGALLSRRGAIREALQAQEAALTLDPTFAPARLNRAASLLDVGRAEESLLEYDRLIHDETKSAPAQLGRGNALLALRRLDEAIEAYRTAAAIQPDFADAFINLCNALRQRGQFAAAVEAGRQAISLRPNAANAANNLATALQMVGQYDDAIAEYRRAIALQPNFADAYYNLGSLLQETGDLDQAVTAYKQALQLQQDMPQVYGNLGNALREMGRLDDAMESYRKATSLKTESKAANNLLFGLHFHPNYGPREILQEHRRWNQIFAAPLASSIRPHPNDRTPDRQLRVGFLSPDLSVHPVGRFLRPLLAYRNRSQTQVYCYSDVRRPDAMTVRLQKEADVWRVTLGMEDETVAEMIRADGIDILIDLTMHAEGTRLLVFARKPAPVQATYLAYAGTTGLDTIDYRISDPYLDPPGGDESVYSEKTIRLAHSYWCYEPPTEAGEIKPRPAGDIMFGCLNNYAKISPPCWKTWCEILRRVPTARLIAFAREGIHRQRPIQTLQSEGINPDRLQFVGATGLADYFKRYDEIDIALDPFPYPGGTTTCDALWMGVPVVSLAGKTAVSRGGLSILSNIGLPDLVTRNVEVYVQTAIQLANDREKLRELRTTLRERMQQSPLMNAKLCAEDFDAVVRQMWICYCQSSY
jgi:protein O-GlcNAc transferase